jgi:ketosteroid isomerase-like protein
MSEENVKVVRRAVEEFNARGFEGLGESELVTDDIEFHEPPDQPAPRVARGREETRRLSLDFDSAWQSHRSEPKEIRAVDADRVLLITTEHLKGRDGIELEAPFAAVFTLRDRKICRWQAFWDKQKALEAAGLSK